MKRSQIVLMLVFLVLTGIIYMSLSRNKKEFSKTIKEEQSTIFVPVRKVKNELKKMTLLSYGQISPNSEIIVSFEVQGKLEKGKQLMKPGTNFSKGQILYKVNSEEAFYSLSARKSSLANLVLNALPDIELDYPSEKSKWIEFMDALKPQAMMPELPSFKNNKERMFMTSRNIITEYYNLKSQESRMMKYMYVAPFSGTVIETYAEPGAIANPGGQIAKIAKTGDFEVKVPISMDDMELYRNKSTASFEDATGKIIASGKIIRVSNVINQQTQSADVYYSIKPIKGEKIYNGMFVNVAINKEATKETMTLPRAAIKNNKAWILKNNKLELIDIMVNGSKPDSVFVTGLTDGQVVLLEQVESIDKDVKYEGITR